MTLTLPVTLGLILAAIAAAVFCGWMGARPRDYAKPRIIPWQLLMLVCAFAVLIFVPHLLSFFGVNTGQNSLAVARARRLCSVVGQEPGMPAEQLLLCRPMGGLNDILTQVEAACRYGERFGRTVVVDTDPPGGRTFRDRFSRYFESRQPSLVLDTDGVGGALDRLDVRPAFLGGRVNSYAVRFSAAESNYVDTVTGRQITFDFAADHPEPLLVHHAAGGNPSAVHALARLCLDPALGQALKGRLAALGPGYTGVHVRKR